MKALAKLAAVSALTLATQAALAVGAGGTWKTIDDETHQPKSLVEISEAANGELSGRVIKLFNNPEAICDKCDGAQKGKPIVGLTIMTGLKKDGDAWENGKILDPKSGKVYSAKAKLVEGGKKLEVRGFLGISLLGRTQVWERQ